ncbi:Pyridoxal phosphate homeostasis protein [Vanrija pseudolonga]|uniref:Pyridoxal phosphate homeostasis protein n=1 Tax=Vanrija pseudolonga TaxID=143232 RepID=A0AAF0YBQ7_9TREE|nr:Pyridoxal phosphate homeostasis protein [Vanrija pseudolonga]
MSQSLEYTPDRGAELRENVEGVLAEIKAASAAGHEARLVAISKIKPASDIQALYDAGHRHFGENYIQEMADKAAILPADICWHFVGSLQSNKAKLLASIPNVFVLETLASVKLADLLQKALAGSGRVLDVYLQVNTSGEDAKSGIEPLTASSDDTAPLVALAEHVRAACPALRVRGLMTIGSWEASHAEGTPNPDFAALKETRANLARILASKGVYASAEEGVKSLEISMGMSADFVEAVKDGSNSVRVGTRIFGARPRKQ